MREKGRDLTQSYDKSPYTNRNVKRAKRQLKLIRNVDLVWQSAQIHMWPQSIWHVVSLYGFINLYPTILWDFKPHIIIKASWQGGLRRWFTCRGVAWSGFESRLRHVFSFFLLPPRSEQLSATHANEIKHDHPHIVIVVWDPRYD